MKRLKRARKYSKFEYVKAGDVKARGVKLIRRLHLDYIKTSRVFFYRSTGSKARAYARTWGLPALWQNALKIKPAYIIEVISNHFDRLSVGEQDKVILHELSHIPKTFSGALTPHTHRKKGSFKHKLNDLILRYIKDSRTL